MQKPTEIEDPSLRWLARDFDALADVLRHLMERDRSTRSSRETVAEREMEFTTEWQMVSTVEEVHPN
jgi:hypothetical protein